MPYADPDKYRAYQREWQRRRLAAMPVEERRAMWRANRERNRRKWNRYEIG